MQTANLWAVFATLQLLPTDLRKLAQNRVSSTLANNPRLATGAEEPKSG